MRSRNEPALPAFRRAPHLLDASMFWTGAGGAGGVHRVIQTKRARLTARGWRHTLLAPGATGPNEVDCGGWPIPHSGGYRFVVDRARAAALIEQARPDIVEAADPYVLGWAVLDACAQLRVPAVAFCHSNLPALLGRLAGGGADNWRARWTSRAARRYLSELYARYDLVAAPSRGMAVLLREWGVPQARYQPLGVDCSVFAPEARDPAWRRGLLEQLALAPHTRLLVYCGRFAPEKRLGLLAQAVRSLGPGHVLLAVGSGPCPPAGPGVCVLGPEHDDRRLARLVASCDAFVHAGDQETFGLAALEAMACGTPVVVSAQAGLGELASGVGQTVRSGRRRAWAEAIDAALGDSAQGLAQLALQRARALDWSRVLELQARRYAKLMRC